MFIERPIKICVVDVIGQRDFLSVLGVDEVVDLIRYLGFLLRVVMRVKFFELFLGAYVLFEVEGIVQIFMLDFHVIVGLSQLFDCVWIKAIEGVEDMFLDRVLVELGIIIELFKQFQIIVG